MTTQQIDRDLAEKVMGWKCKGPMFDGFCFMRNEDTFDGLLVGDVRHAYKSWSPSTSRDDCAEVLGKLTDEQWESFATEISKSLTDKYTLEEVQAATDGQLMKDTLTATPAQISEAVRRATCQ